MRDFLIKERSKGIIEFDDIDDVFDFKSYVQEVREKFPKSTTPMKAENWFTYNITDKIQTYWYKYFRHK